MHLLSFLRNPPRDGISALNSYAEDLLLWSRFTPIFSFSLQVAKDLRLGLCFVRCPNKFPCICCRGRKKRFSSHRKGLSGSHISQPGGVFLALIYILHKSDSQNKLFSLDSLTSCLIPGSGHKLPSNPTP